MQRLDHDPTILIPGYHVEAPTKMPVPEHVLALALANADKDSLTAAIRAVA